MQIADLPAQLRSAVEAVAAALHRAPLCMAAQSPLDVALREAEALVLTALGLPRSTLYADPARALSIAERSKIAGWCARRCNGEPFAYLVGEREFWSLTFAVSPAVLVPRPETELLVERALQLGDAIEADGVALPTVLDLGTGSGAIAIAIAHERPGWRVTAVERSPAALAVAASNAARHRVDIEMLQGDWFAPVAGRRFHIIAANPPYVATDDAVLSGDSLRYEPREALTAGADEFADLAHLATQSADFLEPHGSVLLEHGSTQGLQVRAKLVAQGFRHVVSHRDLAGHERVTEGQLHSAPANV